MLGALRFLFGWLGAGPLDRILSTVDKRIAAETDREALKADIIKTHYATRADFMRAGGFWLMLIFALPLGVWFAAVCLYSILWCRLCAYPQTWSIAALPAPLDEWAGLIVMAIFGVIGLQRFKR
ncbi:MAG TPA: hypothetical protein PLR41_18185 [Alphaproteobacteria bacterium]|nr:hypothetical protein [Alphaproteobacteria bacterium]